MSTAFPLTDEQRAAVTATDRSILVSAAAGSGKTTVLAERCAYLVCDAPEDERCDVNQLLVLTFTEAAAAEMRSRIIEAIRLRVEKHPGDERLGQQLVDVDASQISTIHSFCLWMIRRWFDQAPIDPMASVLDADDASVLKREVLDDLFERRYAVGRISGSTLGEFPSGVDSRHEPTDFEQLVEVYGLGQDREIAAFVLKLYEFTTSLDDPQTWLEEAVTNLAEKPEWAIMALLQELQSEIDLQIAHVQAVARGIQAGDPCGHDYAKILEAYVGALSGWKKFSQDTSPHEALDRICKCIQGFSFEKVPPLRKPTEQQKETRNAASKLAGQVKKLFDSRLRERFGYFCGEEWVAGLRKIAPFVRTIVELVREFEGDYAARKRQLNVLDFADLERFAFELVKDRDGGASSVATALRDRFKHVLIDEFQDVSPIQKAILEAVSRESDPTRPANLFAVGDVKQSIYRFRLAEPEIFLNRLTTFRGIEKSTCGNVDGQALFLQHNFRSRREIIDVVNFLFRKLMSGGLAGLRYDEHAELRSGLSGEKLAGDVPVELHLLERRLTAADPNSDSDDESGEDNDTADTVGVDELDRGVRYSEPPERWDAIVREAYLAATKIKQMAADPASGQTPFRYCDVAILLRNTKFTADRVAEVLTRMGIPAHAQVGGSLMGAREVRDLVAALQVLDNFQQDIPLAGVLRSGIFGDRFTEDELVEIRLTDANIAFHGAVRNYAKHGADENLRRRLDSLLRWIQSYRDEVTRRPLAQTIWNLLEEQGYLACVAGLPNAAQRQANLLKLYDLARRFSSARRQGLHRFLRLIESLDDDDQPIAVTPAGGARDNVVRIMSIHHAKGMEFPVVFLLGLGTQFNLGDRKGRMIFERKSRIGLRAIDTDRMLEYPTAVHQLVSCEVERSTRQEELRVLYVALTRAKQRLILSGSIDQVGRFANRSNDGTLPCTALRMATARTPIDWILPALNGVPDGFLAGLGRRSEKPTLEVTLHLPAEMQTWTFDAAFDKNLDAMLRSVSRFEPLPEGEPRSENSDVDQALRRIHTLYPWLSTSSVRATFGASAFPPAKKTRLGWTFQNATGVGVDSLEFEDAARRGSLTHRALEHLNFQIARDRNSALAELERMVADKVFLESEKTQILHEGIAWFVATPLAEAIRKARDYRREFRFVTTEPLSVVDPTVVADDDRVLVRGIIDGILVRDAECEIIDFKTDAISASQASERCEIHRPQMQVYARAVERLWNRPVRCCRLVFLAAQCTIDLQPREQPR